MTVQEIGIAARSQMRSRPGVAGWGGRRPALRRAAPDARSARVQSVESAVLLMLDGRLDISSYRGRETLERGSIAICPTFDCRAVRAGPDGAIWLQLPWRADGSIGATYALGDVDALLRLARHDLAGALDAVQALAERETPCRPLRLHWIDDLRSALAEDPHLGIAAWACRRNVSREGATRAFRAAYSVAPARFRLELRARSAWARIVAGCDPLSLIALETGFADQSHMTRAVGWFTGRSPSAWRRAH